MGIFNFPMGPGGGSGILGGDWTQLFTDPLGRNNPIPSLAELWERSQKAQQSGMPSTDPAAYAQLADAFGGGQLPQPAPQQAPQSFNMPMPQPRPAPGVTLGMPSAPQPMPTPQPAQLQPPPAPTPSPQAQPPMLAPASPSAGDRMSAGFQSWANTPTGSPFAGLANLISGATTGRRTDLSPMDLGTDPNTGRKMFGTYDSSTNTINPVGHGGGMGGQSGENNGFLAPGVSYLNSTATGDEYLKQFSPEVQAAAKAYLAGHIVPSGNPRQNALASKAKEVAAKYAADKGVPFSDALFSEMRKYRTELGSNSPNTVGGAVKGFNQGIEHMEKLAKTELALDNSNGFGIPKLAEIINGARQMTSTDQHAIAVKADGIGQTLAGEVAKLFSGSAGGGVEERKQTRERFKSIHSPKEMAAALEGTLETMYGGLQALEKNRDRIFGGNAPPDIQFVDAGTKESIKKIEGMIAQLRGGSAAAAPTSGWSVKKL